MRILLPTPILPPVYGDDLSQVSRLFKRVLVAYSRRRPQRPLKGSSALSAKFLVNVQSTFPIRSRSLLCF